MVACSAGRIREPVLITGRRAMSFQGWPEEALEFYEGLEADNSRTYWLAHKDVYDGSVLLPMTELMAELEPAHGESKIFRPYRDVRFSKDKSPYKTAIGALARIAEFLVAAQPLNDWLAQHVGASDQPSR
jgi:hypothetical protein